MFAQNLSLVTKQFPRLFLLKQLSYLLYTGISWETMRFSSLWGFQGVTALGTHEHESCQGHRWPRSGRARTSGSLSFTASSRERPAPLQQLSPF